ncbi:putative leucine carboxyl methyltransferase [Leptomonas pyrrhocoris]|uniref:Leucine carboxyl methyltransferase 1 n=1 Tax=Leptomonas pyrrhocoris TaxID=157538 RepID=A0A0M9G0R0_LEPPY|nr:putative leucine carboxyl methyltransferase [Leptomonas pyrrhocoris]XP_015658254.1 putative leucine carboxyl methyltransferase [Leptomonas pyrrhocoris]XP_015658255.1 putative leucine carboxyl methyltransferase [Leptomonas pyrrhocoris]KPA79814.1 putative leucine carboxyl methyltransferase [Leptomonas pyrrhocoris]KPA79815.1 putative leucine carboxyl methyltransferase [Leptomonas pyrrhocoris]KPA79816.1 putative leucine carboxyl methyltransferase [Leptomonas pyrrhocoris]|eukprot:XP_015658253.1 putative leucine carboxyl methyltransferase [Leptomonas pyrrhocoris]
MALQRTAHDACSRKIHCVRKHYLDDPFVTFFAKDETIVNSPLMNRGTWLRAMAIENCVKGFAAAAGQPVQVINFGAGMDTLFFRLKQANPDFPVRKFVELDFADLVAEKERIIRRHAELSSLVQSEYVIASCNLYDAKGVAEVLKQHLQSGIPTIMLAEMVFVYIEGSVTTELLKTVMSDVIGLDTNTMLVTYDAIEPFDRFGKVMVENLQQFGAEFKGIADFPTTEAHAQRCRDLGFKTVTAVTMKSLYLSVPRKLQIGLNKLEMIDDWEEWNLVHEHYGFVVASTEDAPLPKLF